MTLIKCPECTLQVSDKAISCHCGYPLDKPPAAPKNSTHKFKRLPNSFGSITYLKDANLRNPYRGKRKGEKITASAGTKARIKSLFNLMFDYALEYEIVQTNFARTFDISKDILKEKEEGKREYIPFTEKELQTLWDNVDKVKFVDWVLIQTYMGWRPKELATLRLDEVDLEKWYAQAGMKTDAGKQRIVPIHTRIRSLVKQNYDYAVSGSPFLFNDKGQTHAGSWKVTYDNMRIASIKS